MKKSITLNSKELQSAIQLYLEDPTLTQRKKIVDLITPYVYYFPLYAFSESREDRLSDFYTAFLEKIDKVLEAYKPEFSLFSTFLARALKNAWINFFKKKKQEEILFSGSELKEDVLSHLEGHGEGDMDVVTLFALEKNPFHLLILKLYFFDFFTEDDLLELKTHSGKSYQECLLFLKKIVEEMFDQRARVNFYEQRIQKTHALLLRYRHRGAQDKEREMEKVKAEYLARYRAVRVYPSFSSIANFLEVDRIKVSNIVHQFKSRIKKKGLGVLNEV